MMLLKKSMDMASRLFLNAMLAFFSLVVPKRRGTALFGSALGRGFRGNSKYLYLFLCEKRRCRDCGIRSFSWVTESAQVECRLRGRGLPVLRKHSIRAFWEMLRAEFLFLEGGGAAGFGGHDIFYERLAPGRFRIVQTWHGTPFKRICLDALADRANQGIAHKIFEFFYRLELRSYRLILSACPAASEILRSAFDNPNVEVLGYPRNDILFDRSFRSEALAGLVSKYRRVLSYIPTFRDGYDTVKPFDRDFLQKLDAFLRERNELLLVKKHPYERSIEIPGDLTNIKDVFDTVEDVQELLAHTDVLVTDYSSVCFDFALLSRPVVFYCYDFEDYLTRCRKLPYDYFEEFPGPFARTPEELLRCLQNTDWFEEEGYRQKYRAFRDKFNTYQDGGSCERVIARVFGKRKKAKQS